MMPTHAVSPDPITEEYEFHPAASLFPLLEVDSPEFGELLDDIREQGLLEPITLYEGKVLDGRNRLRACQMAGVKPRFVQYEGDDPWAYAIRKNLLRRHLTDDQRAAIAAEALPRIQEERAAAANRARREAALEQPREGSGFGSRSEADRPQTWQPNASRREAAQQFNVSEKKVRQAAALKVERPDLADAVQRGELKLPEAQRRAADARSSQSDAADAAASDSGRARVEAQRVLHRAYRQMVDLSQYDHRSLIAILSDSEREQVARAVPKLLTWLGRVQNELKAYRVSAGKEE